MGSVEDGCIWQNQNRSITAQLQLGIRFLTLDTCILPDHCVNVYGGGLSESRLMACQGGMDEVPFGGYRYAGLITEVLRQINTWMDNEENRNEVIGLLFTNNSPETNKSVIIEEIIRLLEQEWCPDGNGSEICSNSGNVTLSTHYNQTNSWPTLSQAIDTNSRIFVFIEGGLNVDNLIRVWMNPAPVSIYTFTEQSTNTDCSSLVESAQHCNTTTELFSATGFVLGVCNDNVQQDCNSRLANYSDVCYQMRQQYGQTVNVLLVNYPEQAKSPNTVFEIAEKLNKRNVQMYLSTTTTNSSNSTVTTAITANTKSIIATTTTAGNLQRCESSIFILILTEIVAIICLALTLSVCH